MTTIHPAHILHNLNPGSVIAYVDGACRGNPGGPGGFGALLIHRGEERELFGGVAGTTNNRMELMGAIVALESLNRPCEVVVCSDSKYVIDGASKWLAGWKVRGWRTAGKAGQEVKNIDLWKRLDDAAARHRVSWTWVKGHSGIEGNERADRLALAGMLQVLSGPAPAIEDVQAPPWDDVPEVGAAVPGVFSRAAASTSASRPGAF